MNRRQLLTRLGQSLVAIGTAGVLVRDVVVAQPPLAASALFAKEPSTAVITLRVTGDQIVNAIVRDYKANGRLRQVIQEATR